MQDDVVALFAYDRWANTKVLDACRPPKLTAEQYVAEPVPRWSTLRHIVNHSTYHRGQVASKLKRFGIEQPNTDFFFWAIEQSQPPPFTPPSHPKRHEPPPTLRPPAPIRVSRRISS